MNPDEKILSDNEDLRQTDEEQHSSGPPDLHDPTSTEIDTKTEEALPVIPIIPPNDKTMETHHLHHAPHSKKWKDYLYEFLMLFLAVTLGFFVENQREHYIEGQREKQFIRSLVTDLIADTAKLNNIVNRRTIKSQNLDSLSLLINGNPTPLQNNHSYYFSATATRLLSVRFYPNDGTMQQLKNSGAFRLIRSRIIADSIAKYDVSVRNMLRQGELEENIANDFRQASSKIFNARIYEDMMDEDVNVIRRLDLNPVLLNYNIDDLHDWNYKLYSIKTINKANRRCSTAAYLGYKPFNYLEKRI